MDITTSRVVLSENDISKLLPREQQFLEDIAKIEFDKPVAIAHLSAHEWAREIAKIDHQLAYFMNSFLYDDPTTSQLARRMRSFSYTPFSGQLGLMCTETLGQLRSKKTCREDFLLGTRDLYRALTPRHFDSRQPLTLVETRVSDPHVQLAAYSPAQTSLADPIVIGVILRAGLFPALVVGKELEQITGTTPDYALFRLRRNDNERTYVLDYAHFDPDKIRNSTLVVPEPMLAKGGTILALDKLLGEEKCRPATYQMLSMIGAFEGVLHSLRAIPNLHLTLGALDPALNKDRYICPGIGDVGDELNGKTEHIDDLLRHYGPVFCGAYANQITKIYEQLGRSVPADIVPRGINY